MKNIVILGDGMADYKIEALGNNTILDVAKKPNMDLICEMGEIGLARTVPESMAPGSDNANLAVMGYNALECYTGRSPLEAVSMGVNLTDDDVTFRCNLVTLSDDIEFENKTMVDYSAGEISTEEAKGLIEALKPVVDDATKTLFAGISYRHCLKYTGFKGELELTPPHDISDKKITSHLPKGDEQEYILDLYKKCYEVLKNHEINKKRIAKGLNPANSIWLWGMGTKPQLQNFYERNGVKGAVISAVDLIKGIGMLAGMEIIEVPGAIGTVDTNFEGKCEAAIDAFKRGLDFVYVHMEAPDESGHHGSIEDKMRSVELIDEKVVGPVYNYLKSTGEDFRILIMPDHPTPIKLKTHVKDPVPFALYKSYKPMNCGYKYNEDNGKKSGLIFEDGYKLLSYMLENETKDK